MPDDYLDYSSSFNTGIVAGTTYASDSQDRSGNYALHTARNEQEYNDILKTRECLVRACEMSGLITLKQTHSDIIHIITDQNRDIFLNDPLIEGDGIITSCHDTLIGVLTADCVPILYHDSVNNVIGACHAGWKGIYQNIHLSMIRKMAEYHDTKAADIKIMIGPHIRSCCYEVSMEFITNFEDKYFTTKSHKPHFDMKMKITDDLLKNGILNENIFDSKQCVYYNNEHRFFSYRKGDKYHRNLSFIGITGNNA